MKCPLLFVSIKKKKSKISQSFKVEKIELLHVLIAYNKSDFFPLNIHDFPTRFYLHVSRQLNTECEVGGPETNGLRDGLSYPSTSIQLMLVPLNLTSSQEASRLITTFLYTHRHWVLNKQHLSLTVSTSAWSTGSSEGSSLWSSLG